MGEDEIRGPALSPGSAKCDPVLLCQVDGKRRFFPAGTGKQHGYRDQGNWAAPGAGRNGGSMKKRVMCVHTELVREGSVLYEGKDGNTGITTTEEAAGFAASFFGKQDKELLYVCAVNGELEPVLMELVAKGSKNVCYAEPADIFKSAILANAYGIFCFHNHPGGRAKASKEDIDLTARLEACGVMLGIPLLDHIIISSQGEVYSIKEQDEEKLNETMNRMFDKKNE